MFGKRLPESVRRMSTLTDIFHLIGCYNLTLLLQHTLKGISLLDFRHFPNTPHSFLNIPQEKSISENDPNLYGNMSLTF